MIDDPLTAAEFVGMFPGARADSFDGTCEAFVALTFGSIWRLLTEGTLRTDDPVRCFLGRGMAPFDDENAGCV